MPKLFISYRRADASDAAGRIFDRLIAVFGRQNVLKDIDSIAPGAEFVNWISDSLNKCDAVIVVIGNSWLRICRPDGTSRLDDPGDLVRIEVETALARKTLVIPVLVGMSTMPKEEELPVSIRGLTRKNAISIRPDPDFHRDMDRLIRTLRGYFERTKPPLEKPSAKRKPKVTSAFHHRTDGKCLVWLACTVVFYGVSFILPTVDMGTTGTPEYHLGWVAFMVCLNPGSSFVPWARVLFFTAWLANPLLWCSMIALGAGFRIAARVLASCGFAFALIGSVYDLPMMWALPGFWVWLACLVSIFAASFLAHPNGAQGNA